jgi:hypothetical protein
MINETYIKQVGLLLDILPFIAKNNSFALHGGTAINLFHLNKPRLSIDIDLTYVPSTSDRETDLNQNPVFSFEKKLTLSDKSSGYVRRIIQVRFTGRNSRIF